MSPPKYGLLKVVYPKKPHLEYQIQFTFLHFLRERNFSGIKIIVWCRGEITGKASPSSLQNLTFDLGILVFGSTLVKVEYWCN
jgi:hypothetical protein